MDEEDSYLRIPCADFQSVQDFVETLLLVGCRKEDWFELAKERHSSPLRFLGAIVVLFLVGLIIYNGIILLAPAQQSTSDLSSNHSFVVSLTSSACWNGLIGGPYSGDSSVQGCGSRSWTITDNTVNVSFQTADGLGKLSLTIVKDGQTCLQKNASAGSVNGAC